MQRQLLVKNPTEDTFIFDALTEDDLPKYGARLLSLMADSIFKAISQTQVRIGILMI